MRRVQENGPRWVSQLINNKEWNKTLVEELLSEEDMIRALAIRLDQVGIRDRLVWNHTKSGLYITSSGYLTAMEMRRNGKLGGRRGVGQVTMCPKLGGRGLED
ncbi:hypothetical protein LIER_02915 [Lithospermum erythrorhizon]|uniref:Uncharacterized protein n=1 Tax=Lithospermum erythrorhizon TaxID=34254 RepID=A0AAV3NRA2_LITER